MIYLGKDRPELRPDTTSFNTVLDTLAKSLENDREERAEALLEKMEELSESDASLNCRPNEVVRRGFIVPSMHRSVLFQSCYSDRI